MDKEKENCVETLLSDFQTQVEKSLIRHKSIIDIMTKMEEYNARMNRSIAKSVTRCGCIEINASKQNYDSDTLEEFAKTASNHVKGDICPSCKENLEREMGAYLFYLIALCNTFDIEIAKVLDTEYANAKALGFFSMK